jgi:hypothetical protein
MPSQASPTLQYQFPPIFRPSLEVTITEQGFSESEGILNQWYWITSLNEPRNLLYLHTACPVLGAGR